MAGDGTLDVSLTLEIEYENGELDGPAHFHGRQVHHPQIIADDLVECQLFVADRVRIDFRRSAINAVDFGRLEKDLRFQFAGTQGSGGVGGHERVTGPAGQNHDALLLEMPQRSSADKWLGDFVHVQGGHQAGLATDVFQRVLEGQPVHYRGQHAHVVGRRIADDRSIGRELGAAQNIAAADYHGQFHATFDDSFCLPGDAQRFVQIDAALAAGAETLATELQHDPRIFWSKRFIHFRSPSSAVILLPRLYGGRGDNATFRYRPLDDASAISLFASHSRQSYSKFTQR